MSHVPQDHELDTRYAAIDPPSHGFTTTSQNDSRQSLLLSDNGHDNSVNSKTLARSLGRKLSLIVGDILAIVAWSFMLAFAIILCVSRNKKAVDLQHNLLSPQMMLEATPLVS